jgi:hypothetical protein
LQAREQAFSVRGNPSGWVLTPSAGLIHGAKQRLTTTPRLATIYLPQAVISQVSPFLKPVTHRDCLTAWIARTTVALIPKAHVILMPPTFEPKTRNWKMGTCKFNDFLKVLKPWLDRDYIRKVHLIDQDKLVLFFSDGGQKEFFIDDCTKAQLKGVLEEIRQIGIPVEKAE